MTSRRLSYVLQQQVHLYTPEANELREQIDRYVEAERQIEGEMARRRSARDRARRRGMRRRARATLARRPEHRSEQARTPLTRDPVRTSSGPLGRADEVPAFRRRRWSSAAADDSRSDRRPGRRGSDRGPRRAGSVDRAGARLA